MKYCIGCSQNKKEIEFAWHNQKLKKLKSRCILCSTLSTKTYVEQVISKIIDYLKLHPCVDCQNCDIRVLEFDHLLNKKFNISEMIGKQSWEMISEEIVKCEVRCANCHRIVTHERANTRKQKYYLESIYESMHLPNSKFN